MGHSMGGCLSALAAAKGAAAFDALFLSAPMMGLAAVRSAPRAAGLVVRAARSLGRAGDYILKDGFEPMLGPFADNVLTHDARRYARFKHQLEVCPNLALGGVTWGWLEFALLACAELGRPDVARAVTVPMTVVAAGDDRLVLNAPARRFAERAPQGRYVEIPGSFHEILMETDDVRAQVWREFDRLVSRMGA